MILISGVQLCLAHYCDVHGPTPLMVTEGLPIPCAACYEDLPYNNNKTDVRPSSNFSTPTSTTQSSTTITEALRRLKVDGKHSSSAPAPAPAPAPAAAAVSDHDEPTGHATLRRAAQLASASTTVDTPPVSPRYPPEPSAATGGGHHSRRESSYRRTYDETTTRRAGPCENCAMTLPRRKEGSAGAGGRGADGSDSETGPILRTKAPYARVYGSGVTPGDASPPNSTSTVSDDDGYYEDERTPSHHRSGTITSTTSRSSASSPSGAGTGAVHSHMHFLHYTSSHEPVVPSSFSIVRASCIRTLSFETLPRGASPAAATTTTMMGASGAIGPTSTTTSPVTPGFITTHSSGAAASGGPIFFGDPSAGYTTAYIFRIPDVHARGHKRVYAFLALSTHRERLAMKTFTFISTAFRELAAWIQGLAEAEAERYSSGSGPFSPMAAAQAGQPQQTPTVETTSSTAAGSGFLSGGMGGLSRRMGGGYGYGGSGVALKARGLPELVGMPDFFLELHQKFVRLLLELGVVLSS